jgi:predicted nucleotidyltransferase component of viral defense system
MFELTETKIKKWSAEIGIADLSLTELDIRLMDTLHRLYSDNFLSTRLYLKGGTSINKVYLQKTARLSIDLDFNLIGTKENVIAERNKIRDKIVLLLREQDEGYIIKKKDTYEQTTVKAGYKPVFGPSKQYMKIEISHIERFPVLNNVIKELKSHDSKDVTKIYTYTVEELIATKLRALYDRLKGRDIYDLYYLSSLNFEISKQFSLYKNCYKFRSFKFMFSHVFHFSVTLIFNNFILEKAHPHSTPFNPRVTFPSTI